MRSHSPPRASEGPLLAPSRTSSTRMTTAQQPGRISFAKIREPLEVPNLLALQTSSFDWLVGNDGWAARVQAGMPSGRDDAPTPSGLEAVLGRVSPTEAFSGSISLSLRDHRFEPTTN